MSCLLNVIDKDKKTFKSKDSFFTNNLIISDLDSFFQDIYSYYYHGGYNNIVTRVVLDNITYIFTIHFLMFKMKTLIKRLYIFWLSQRNLLK